MNRRQEITKAALGFSPCLENRRDAFIKGAQWADKHPSSSFIVKVWNLATKTAIAQIIKEMDEFKSENEVKEFIIKHLKL